MQHIESGKCDSSGHQVTAKNATRGPTLSLVGRFGGYHWMEFGKFFFRDNSGFYNPVTQYILSLSCIILQQLILIRLSLTHSFLSIFDHVSLWIYVGLRYLLSI